MKVIYVEKKEGFQVGAKGIYRDLKENLNMEKVENVRVLNRYVIENISEETYEKAKYTIFAEGPVDCLYEESFPMDEEDFLFGIEYLPGQYDQRKDFSIQCVKLIEEENINVHTGRIIIVKGKLKEDEKNKIKNHLINEVDSREMDLNTYIMEENTLNEDEDIIVKDFIHMDEEKLKYYYDEIGFAMKFEDLLFCQRYFKDEEKRNPTIVELKVIDTYWSDHCRHTTFLTEIEEIQIDEGHYKEEIEGTLKEYLQSRDRINNKKPISLMDLAQINMKELRHDGMLNDLEESSEINAASIEVDVKVDDRVEKWLVMFKNETHNHPTEIEPFGGASTCLGGAIRDPLSGRSYVYGAMRITGSGDPTVDIKDTLEGKLPQIKITSEAANGYSSYGNQIGVPTGFVDEVYDEGFLAKRMEVGAVIAANKKENVVRLEPKEGDVVLLVGGRTGRDGCGGATGSSKAHDVESKELCGAEVQKGNAPMERKIQRLFRNERASRLIKKCNDFGAGGVSVAIGELSDSLDIYLDRIPKKYEGLNSLELAISESQERMALVLDKENVDEFISYSMKENVEATVVAHITNTGRIRMMNRDRVVLDMARSFLDTNGVRGNTHIVVEAPEIFQKVQNPVTIDSIVNKLKNLNVCSKRGLIEKFDSTVGGNSILMPLGGKYQLTPQEGMAFKIPVYDGECGTGSIMTYGYNPNICRQSPYHGGIYSVIEALTRIVALGGNYKKVRLSMQEYFMKLGSDPKNWGKPFSSLLGAYKAQKEFGIGSIGGKDSMSGSFNEIHVSPTLITFAVNTMDIENVVSAEMKKVGSTLVELRTHVNEYNIPDIDQLKENFEKISELNEEKKILSMASVKNGGSVVSALKMCFGNKIGIEFHDNVLKDGFQVNYGNMLIEIDEDYKVEELFKGYNYKIIGKTTEDKMVHVNGEFVSLDSLIEKWERPLKKVFPVDEETKGEMKPIEYVCDKKRKSRIKVAKPRVLVPVFPGTNCEYESMDAFKRAGAQVESLVFNNLTGDHIKESIDKLAKKIEESQIIMIPGGFSAGDEPDGSGKFISTVFRNPKISDSLMNMLKNKDGLMLGICNGFQALIKLGLLPYGEIRTIGEEDVTLTYNNIGRHMSKIVKTKVVSNKSPWYSSFKVGDTHNIAISHGEGRFIGSEKLIEKLIQKGQVSTQYVDLDHNPTYDIEYNPNGSMYAIEGITSEDGRILGKMAHSERMRNNTAINVGEKQYEDIFKNGVEYFL
jgi:phosphoribosylformylglycinamidine synthase